MDKASIIRLQTNLKVTPDGIIGKGTLTALFARMGANATKAKAYGEAAAKDFVTYGILANPLILAHFMAQAAHETMNFHYDEEIASGKAYEGRKDLGNTVAGYGVKYKGRGIFQLTGYSNYLTYGKKLGLDLAGNPKLAADYGVAVSVACLYWQTRGLTKLALADDVRGVTKRINGGFNGLDDRVAKLKIMKGLLGLK